MMMKEESEKAALKLNIQKTKIMASIPMTSWQIDRETMKTVTHFIFLGSEITVDSDWSHEIKRCLLLGRKAMANLYSIFKRRHYFVYKCQNSQSCGFSSSHVWMWEQNNKKDWASDNWCLQTVQLEKTPESLLDSKEIKSINTKGNHPWIFIRRTDAEAEASIHWPLDMKSWLFENTLMLGKNEGRKRRGQQRLR